MPIAPINVTLPTSEPVTVPLGICTRCGYPGPVGTKCTNPRGCESVADPFAAFIGHAQVNAARLALEAAAEVAEEHTACPVAQRCPAEIAREIRTLDPAAIVKP